MDVTLLDSGSLQYAEAQRIDSNHLLIAAAFGLAAGWYYRARSARR